MTARIIGLGTAFPVHRMSQTDALQMMHDIVCDNDRQRRLASMMFRKSGVANRNSAVPHLMAYEWASRDADQPVHCGLSTGERMQLFATHAPELATQAAQRALTASSIGPADITHLVTVSCTGFDAPGVDIALLERLSLRATTQRVHVGYMGCHGGINGLRTARGLSAVEPGARVLMCAYELCSLHYRFTWDDEGMIANALFADGAAALVLSDELNASASPGWTVTASGSCLIPNSREAMSWRIGDDGFVMTLTSEVPKHIEQSLRPWIDDWLESSGLTAAAVDHWVIHPGGPKILDAAERALGLSSQKTELSRAVLAEHGNMSSPTVLFILERIPAASAHGTCVLLGFGPGLMAEACLLRR